MRELTEAQKPKAKQLALELTGQGFSDQCLVFVQYYPEGSENADTDFESLSWPKAPGTDMTSLQMRFYTLAELING